MKRISKYPHYILTWLPYIIIALFILIFFFRKPVIGSNSFFNLNFFVIYLLILILAFFAGFIAKLTLLHKMWSSIQFSKPRTTPGKAVKYLFIPFYNYYWYFQVYQGFAQDYNLKYYFHLCPHHQAGVVMLRWDRIPVKKSLNSHQIHYIFYTCFGNYLLSNGISDL